MLLGALVGCGGGDSGSRSKSAAAATLVPGDERLMAMPLPALEALLQQASSRATAELASERGVALTLDVARVARVVALKGGAASSVARAREVLATAARRRDLPGACRAALELARMEGAVAHDAAAAYVASHGLVTRFEGVSGAQDCVAEARRMLSILEAHRPAASSLARESLAATLEGPPPTGARDSSPLGDRQREAELDGFVARRAEREEEHATLRRIAVYGGAAPGAAGAPSKSVRAVLHFDGVAVYRRGEIAASDGVARRLFLDLDEVRVDPSLAPALPVGAGGLASIRILNLGESSARVSFDVGEGTAYRLFVMTEPYRIVMDFRDEMPRERATRARWTVVLDPGHGGSQPGAKSGSGLRESDVALALARRVKRALERTLSEVRVILTRDGDDSVSLEERTAIANGYDADVFVSIHLNASPSGDDQGGVATFVLDTTNDDAALRLAARENGTDAADVTELQVLLASLYRADQVQKSLALAELVHGDTLRLGRRYLPELPDRGVKRAMFYVLVGARMPAVLVEASFITRPEEAAALERDEYRDLLSEGIASGIHTYLLKSALVRDGDHR